MEDYPHPTWIEIDLDQFRLNLKIIRNFIRNARFCLPVKANAYGHGLVRMAQAAEPLVDCLGVSCLQEGVQLRLNRISIPILVLGAIHESQIEYLERFNLEFSVSSKYKAELIAEKLKGKCRVHLEIETGMQRTGVRAENAVGFFEHVNQFDCFEVVGMYSHLATGDMPNHPFALEQIQIFSELIQQKTFQNLTCHLANSGGVAHYQSSHLDMVRPGLLAFGYLSQAAPKELMGITPCFSLKSRISFFKVVKENQGVSYGHTFVTKKATRLVTVPIGYGDGFPRALSNVGSCLIRGKRYPIRGAICMDQFMCEVGEDEAFVGDEVVLIGKQGDLEIPLVEVSELSGTIPYETLCLFNGRIPRVYLG